MALDDTSDEELDEMIRDLMPEENQLILPRVALERRLFGLQGSDEDFRRRFRLPKPIFVQLLRRLEGTLQHMTQRRQALSPQQQLLTFLQCMGTNSVYHVTRDVLGPSQSTVCRVIKRVSNAIVNVLEQDYVKFPTNLRDDVDRFHEIAGMPNVIGAVDGTHVRVMPPSTDEGAYVNRHHLHSLNVMIVSSANHNISFVSSKCPGGWHDSRVLRMSSLWTVFEENAFRPFPGSIILGDSAYPCRSWLITPLPERRQLTQQEQRYNRSHKRTRVIVERTIGILKQRFRVLLECVRLRDMKEVAILVKSLCILHNLCIQQGDDARGFEPVNPDHDDGYNDDEQDETVPQARRNAIIASF